MDSVIAVIKSWFNDMKPEIRERFYTDLTVIITVGSGSPKKRIDDYDDGNTCYSSNEYGERIFDAVLYQDRYKNGKDTACSIKRNLVDFLQYRKINTVYRKNVSGCVNKNKTNYYVLMIIGQLSHNEKDISSDAKVDKYLYTLLDMLNDTNKTTLNSLNSVHLYNDDNDNEESDSSNSFVVDDVDDDEYDYDDEKDKDFETRKEYDSDDSRANLF